jgi:hypothetical protein
VSSLDVLKDLQDRITALERQLGDAPGADSLAPNVITVDASGHIGAQFSGKVQASELDLVGGAGASPIKWVTTSGGLLAELTVDAAGNLTLSPAGLLNAQGVVLPTGAGSLSGANQVAWKRGASTDGTAGVTYFGGSQNYNAAELTAYNPTGDGSYAQLLASSGTVAHITGAVQGQSATLIDSAGSSTFPIKQSGSNQNVIDDNNGALYVVSTGIPANGFANVSFATRRGSWSVGAPFGSLSPGIASVGWTYGFTAPNTWTITFTNLAGVAQNATWAGFVYGR